MSLLTSAVTPCCDVTWMSAITIGVNSAGWSLPIGHKACLITQCRTELHTKATLKRSRTLWALVQHVARVKSVPVNKCRMRRQGEQMPTYPSDQDHAWHPFASVQAASQSSHLIISGTDLIAPPVYRVWSCVRERGKWFSAEFR
jgi:hypothetical protein